MKAHHDRGNRIDLAVDQVIMTFPNTFTRNQRDLLQELTFQAFNLEFGVQLPERIHLVSESDAVAVEYCKSRKLPPREGTERLLVYDFGAGTLDLSLIHVDWQLDPHVPRCWRVLARTGVPVAGNHIDALLALCVDRVLRRLSPELEARGYVYGCPLAADPVTGVSSPDHRLAIVDFWTRLKAAKHGWTGEADFSVRIGSSDGGFRNTTMVYTVSDQAGEIDGIGDDVTGSRIVKSASDIMLCIPPAAILGSPDIVEFTRFVTDDVVRETLGLAGLAVDGAPGTPFVATGVDTVVVSGRGAQWPGIREGVLAHFPDSESLAWASAQSMKEAVVRGAIARQDWGDSAALFGNQRDLEPRLAVRYEYDSKVKLLDPDGAFTSVDLADSPTFQIVQVMHANPDPSVDVGLRQHFYIPLLARLLHRDEYAGPDNVVHLSVGRTAQGRFIVRLKVTNGRTRTLFGDEATPTGITAPPWPVGTLRLQQRPDA